jgi:PHD/YefM family antitoxin component YafN of YafNO toxin-antitoxin module
MAFTLTIPDQLLEDLRVRAQVEHRSMQQTVILAVKEYLAARETDEILADPAALRDIAAAREEIAERGIDLRAVVAARPDAQ